MIAVTGVAPGEAWITWSGSKQVPIFVVCDAEPPIRPVVAKIDATYAKPVTLTLESPILPRAALMWYAGRVGDTSRRITSGGRSIQYTPAALGTEYVWAEAWTPCSHSTAEFRIDVTVPRRRAARFPR